MKRFLRAVSLAGLVAGPAAGHDFWIQPSSMRPEVGAPIMIHLRVGDGFPGDPVPRSSGRIERFVVIGPGEEGEKGEEKPVVGQEGADPAGIVRAEAPGLHIVAYRGTPASITLEAEKFEAYLREEGLERISARRAERGQTGQSGRESYSRCAKALVDVGSEETGGGGGEDRPVGLLLELVAEKNPYALRAGDEVPVRLLFEGAPYEGALIEATNPGMPGQKISARSDAAGRAVLRLPHGGFWLIAAVHMAEAPGVGGGGAGAEADWESLWASLTFELAPGDGGAEPRP